MNLREEKGYTMVAVIVTVVILSIMITAVSTLALSDVRKSKLWRDETAAFYLAESGINEALYRIMAGEPYNPSGLNPTYSSATLNGDPARYDFGPGNYYEVWVEKLENEGVLKLTSKGTSNKITKVVEQKIQLPAVFPPSPESFAKKVIETEPGRKYYDPSYVAPEIQVNSPDPAYPTIDLNQKITDQQRVLAGDYQFSGNIIVTKQGSKEVLTIGEPSVPGEPVKTTNLYFDGDLTLSQNVKIIVEGNVTFHIKGNLTFENNNQLDNTNGKTVFFVEKNVSFNGNCIMGSSDPTKLIVYLSTDPVFLTYTLYISNNTLFIGGLGAPSAKVWLDNGSIINGAVVGRQVIWGNGQSNQEEQVQVTYHPSMASITLPGANWSLKGWSEQ